MYEHSEPPMQSQCTNAFFPAAKEMKYSPTKAERSMSSTTAAAPFCFFVTEEEAKAAAALGCLFTKREMLSLRPEEHPQ